MRSVERNLGNINNSSYNKTINYLMIVSRITFNNEKRLSTMKHEYRKHEYRKHEKKLYAPKTKPELVVVPKQKFFLYKGKRQS